MFTAGRERKCRLRNHFPPVQRFKHSADHSSIDSTDHRVFDRSTAEGAMLGDDPELAVIVFGMGGETMCGEGVGDSVQGRLEGAVLLVDARRRGSSHGTAVRDANLFGQPFGTLRAQFRQGRTEKGDENIVVSQRKIEGDLRCHDLVALGGAPGSGSSLRPIHRDLHVAAGHQFVEVVTGDVGMKAEAVRDLRCGHAFAVLVYVQIDRSPGRVAERRGDSGNRRSEIGRRERRLVHAHQSTQRRPMPYRLGVRVASCERPLTIAMFDRGSQGSDEVGEIWRRVERVETIQGTQG